MLRWAQQMENPSFHSAGQKLCLCLQFDKMEIELKFFLTEIQHIVQIELHPHGKKNRILTILSN